MYKKQDMKNNKNLFTLVNVIPFFSRKGGLLSLLLCFLFIHPSIASNEGGVKVIDISQQQVRLMNKYQNSSISERNKILIDSLYTPHQYLWNGYLGNENEFAEWLNKTAFNELKEYTEKAKKIDLKKLDNYLFQTVEAMSDFTGHQPEGRWYVFFGPKWTNLGGFGNGTMLIDLAHASNQTIDDIKKFFPHEINHQIYSSYIKEDKDAVLHRILDEGFACYVSHQFHKTETTKAQELGYSTQNFESAGEREKELIELLKKNYQSNNENLSRRFADRGYRFKENYPGAIGYYIGFRIVEEYVKRNGPNSWKDLYHLSPKKALKKSRILRFAKKPL